MCVLEGSRRSDSGGTSESPSFRVSTLFPGFELFISCEVIGSEAVCSAPLLPAPTVQQQRRSPVSLHVV